MYHFHFNVLFLKAPLAQKMAPSRVPSQRPTSGLNCYVASVISEVPIKGDKIRSGYLSPAFSGGMSGRKCHITLAVSVLPMKGDKIKIGCLTRAFRWAHQRAEVLGNPCLLGGPHQTGQN